MARPGIGQQSRATTRACLRSFHRWLLQSGATSSDPTVGLPAVRVPPGLPRPATESQVDAGLGCPDPDTRLMVMLAAHAGLRRHEIAGLRREDLTPWGLRVRGKGGRVRMLPVVGDLAAELSARPAGFVFPSTRTASGHVSDGTVQQRVRKACGVAPHALRHRFATRVYEATGDLLAVQQLLGHASVATTQRYVGVSRDRLVAAMVAVA
jgi:integrase